MPEESMNSQLHEDENLNRKETNEDPNNERFESDTQKIIHRHLKHEDDIITDEDIASVRVGMMPPEFDRATEVRFGDDEAMKDVEEDLTSGTNDMNKDENLDEGQITPWDTIDSNK
jgi:hypothetical protein